MNSKQYLINTKILFSNIFYKKTQSRLLCANKKISNTKILK